MQVFEFHFNPKAKEDKIFDTFLFEPENILERNLGNLYLVGEINNVLPQNLQFLERLSSQIKKEYYRVSERSTGLSLRESLKKTNEFLSDVAQKGNVSWLGNLSLAALSFRDSIFNFTKTGGLKILLLRGGEIFDLGKDLELQEIEPYPLKIFGNIVSGKLSPEDKIIVLSKDIFDFFSSQNLITEIANLETVEEKKLKTILRNKENLLGETSGICLLIDLKGESKIEETQIKEEIAFGEMIPFSFWFNKLNTGWKIFSPRLWLRLFSRALRQTQDGEPSRTARSRVSTKRLSKVKFPSFKLPKLKFPKLRLGLTKKLPLSLEKTLPVKKRIKTPENLKFIADLLNKKNSIIIFVLIIILLIGGLLFSLEKGRELKKAQSILETAESKIVLAENALISNNEKKANILYQETWQEISPHTKVGGVLEKEFSQLKEEIEEKLFLLNSLNKISEPEILFDFEGLNFIPQKMVNVPGKLYFLSSTASGFYQLGIEEKRGDLTTTNQKFSLAAPIKNKEILLYSRPDLLFLFSNEQLNQTISLKTPYSDFYFNSFSAYKSNLYFLDSQKGEIIKYVFKEDKEELSENLWLNPGAKKPTGAKSIVIDGSIWILNKGNAIDRYFAGNWQGTLNLDLFPYPKNFSKIFTSPNHSYLYLLEPSQKRIVILNKAGNIIQQFQSEKFDNLKDFSISADGKIIYLLNGLKIYKVEL